MGDPKMNIERVRRKLIFASTLIGVLALWSGSYVGADGGADGGDEHQTAQNENEPILLGVSGGSIDDSSSAFCCGGTLGALVQDGDGVQYILSNNHILARTNKGISGDLIVQPGLIDVDPVCTEVPSNAVAYLSDFVPIEFNLTNLVDAAIAEVILGRVHPSGNILDIGALNSATLAPSSPGLAVKKSGRTTGLTQGTISAVDVTVNVSIPTKCGPGRGKSATFTDQLRITPGTFSAGGDSGSLIVEDVASLPRAVGLLFAGSSTSTLANRIDNVLSAFGVSMIGGDLPLPLVTGSISGTVESDVDASPLAGATVVVDTGELATTSPNGTYAIADVPIGSRSVTASALGFVSETQSSIDVVEDEATVVDFALDEAIVGTQAIVDCIIYSTAGGRNGDKHLHVTVRIIDDLRMPVAGASVSVTVLGLGSAIGTTDSAGEVTFVAKNAADTCYKTEVTAVVASGLTFDGSYPQNGFLKGDDLTPNADCRSESDDCGGSSFTDTILTSGTGKLRAAIGAKRRNEHSFFSISNKVVGVGVGVANGEAVIEVYLASHDAGVIAQLPDHVENVSVRAVVTGEFVAY